MQNRQKTFILMINHSILANLGSLNTNMTLRILPNILESNYPRWRPIWRRWNIGNIYFLVKQAFDHSILANLGSLNSNMTLVIHQNILESRNPRWRPIWRWWNMGNIYFLVKQAFDHSILANLGLLNTNMTLKVHQNILESNYPRWRPIWRRWNIGNIYFLVKQAFDHSILANLG